MLGQGVRRLSFTNRRLFRIVLAFAMASGAAPRIALAQQPNAQQAAFEARKLLMEADQQARAKHWDAALERYQQSNAASPSPQALLGVANAYYQLGKSVEAFAAYDELLKTYGKQLGPFQREAQSRRDELAGKTGLLQITVNETGAAIAIDGKSYGASPMPAPVRLTAGAHIVKITKDGFLPYESPTDVGGGATANANVTLQKEPTKGIVSVKEKSGQPVRVVVDGLDVGPAPWQGELDPGPHQILVRGASAAAPAQKVDVLKGQKYDLEFAAVPASARLEVTTSDHQGFVFVDGKPVGEGEFRGDVSIGPHVLEVKREGFTTYRKELDLADHQTYAETVTLARPGGSGGGPVEVERPLQGVYGGFALTAVYSPSNLGSELETNCSVLGAVSCTTPAPVGAGLFGYVGYHWDPVGLEVMLGGLFDGTAQRASFDGQGNTGENPLLSSPARNEKFTFLRFGGLGAVRARATLQGRVLRGSLAAGVGLSYKMMEMERKATTADGVTNADSRFVPDGKGYLSPALTADASLQIRLSPTTALAIGALIWAESAGQDTKSAPDPSQRLSNGAPLPTPSYHYASDAQVFVGPYIGMQFGP